jgi:tRNA(Arg) A34 adenosine deaminase TadA
MTIPIMTIRFPGWVEPFLAGSPRTFPTPEERMGFVIQLSRLNIRHGSGGPFGAAVFDRDGLLIAPGINLVASSNCSLLHAEMVALACAQQALGRFDIGDGGRVDCDLYASTEPCAMCFGAIPWSGVSGLACGARGGDARAIGFDEGPKLSDWVGALTRRGISVQRDLLRHEACAVLSEYAAKGGVIYNSGPAAARRNRVSKEQT